MQSRAFSGAAGETCATGGLRGVEGWRGVIGGAIAGGVLERRWTTWGNAKSRAGV